MTQQRRSEESTDSIMLVVSRHVDACIADERKRLASELQALRERAANTCLQTFREAPQSWTPARSVEVEFKAIQAELVKLIMLLTLGGAPWSAGSSS